MALHRDRFAEAFSSTPEPDTREACILTPDEILYLLFHERHGQKWGEVYNGNWSPFYESPSDADLALLMKFAFYAGKDRHMMALLFSQSPLSKILVRGKLHKPVKWRIPKWENPRYRERTLSEAIKRTTATYGPRRQAR